MNVPVDSNSSPAVPTTSKPPRNPVERMIVWGGIGLLLVIVMLEFRAQHGYAQTLDALNASAANEEHETTLNEAMQVFTLSPAVSDPVPFGPYDHVHCSWFSLFKSGQYKITLVCSRDKEPVLLAFTTPSPPPEPEPEVAAQPSGTMTPMGGPGMGMGMSGGPGMGGGARRPNPVREAIDADADGSLSADEIAASSTALAKLDKDTDGSLSSEELAPPPAAAAAPGGTGAPAQPAGGGTGGPGGGASRTNRLEAAIDTNEDGVISAEELAAAPTGLKSLDADSDGTIAAEELRPPGGGGFGGGAGGGAGPGGASTGRSRRPSGEESTSPAVETPVPAPAEAPAPQGDAAAPAPATGTP